MMKLTVLYGNPTNAEAFEQHYRGTHLPLAAKMTGVARLELTRFVTGPDGGKPAFYRMAEVYFQSKAEMEQALDSPAGKATVADISQLATGGATILVGTLEE
ncbi:MAG: EthD family reductase [Casimicrobiaceae bacterium]